MGKHIVLLYLENGCYNEASVHVSVSFFDQIEQIRDYLLKRRTIADGIELYVTDIEFLLWITTLFPFNSVSSKSVARAV